MIGIGWNDTGDTFEDQNWSNTYMGGGWYLSRTVSLGPIRIYFTSRGPHGKGIGFIVDFFYAVLFLAAAASIIVLLQ